MIEAITECMKRISSGQIDNNLITVNKTISNENIFIIDDTLCDEHYHRPTIIINNDIIHFIMTMEQSSLYLNSDCLTAVKVFDDQLMVYINIYEQLQPKKDLPIIDKYIKVTYDVQTQTYDVFFAYHNALFIKHQDSINMQIWSSAIRSAMMRAPNIIVFGELSETGAALLLNNTKKMILFPITNNNLIYSTDDKALDHCFIVRNGLYKENELFNAIQSYLDLTESDNCNILDPNLIKNKTHFDNLMTLHKIIKF
jgi:hypothetical protein